MELTRALVQANHVAVQQVLYYQIAHVGLILRNERANDKARMLLYHVETKDRLLIWDRVEAIASQFMH